VLDAVSDLAFVKGASVVTRAGASEAAPYLYGLLIFLGYVESEEGDAAQQEQRSDIATVIVRHVGRSFLPDEIILLPLYPRFLKDEIDHAWCSAQYLSGSLQNRSEHHLFRAINRARRSTLEA
jgi:hypothetical protein